MKHHKTHDQIFAIQNFLLMGLNNGELDVCDVGNCGRTRARVEGVKKLETFQVVERVRPGGWS